MSTYVYKSFNDKERPSVVIKGVTFTYGTSPGFSSDQLTLNELVPEERLCKLNRTQELVTSHL